MIPTLKLKPLTKKALLLAIFPALASASVAILIFFLKGFVCGYSVLLGVLIWLLPTVLLAILLFRNVSPRAATKIVATLYIAEMVKLATTVFLFILVIHYAHLSLACFWLGYLLSAAFFCITPIFLMMK